ATVTYTNQIARIMQAHCVECHRAGEIAPFALTEYEEVAGWAEMIDEVVRLQRMPPWHANAEFGEFANDCSLSDEEKELIEQWVADGAPQGNPDDLPAPRQFVAAWQLPREPDLVLDVNSKPFQVPATGEVRYQWFTAPTGLTEDKWLAAAEIVPGNRSVVHHILAFTRTPGDGNRFSRREGFLVGYVPGLRVQPLPAGFAKKIPAGSELVFQVHYTPIGSPQTDQSKIGLIFADPDEVTHQVLTRQAANLGFAIPPGARDYQVEAHSIRAPQELLLLGLMPHMHVRGKSFRYELQYADGRSTTLLDVPRYDFNWQTSYRLTTPMPIPAGARIHCVAHFDNSERNLANPDPTKTVRWGDQTWDEMMLGYFDIAVSLDDQRAEHAIAAFQGNAEPKQAAATVIRLLDQNNDGQLARTEVQPRMLPAFLLIDKNLDGQVTLAEMTAAIEHRQAKAKGAAP
ncbi:MAG: hypothetical protein KDA42_19620, partial [Planctomycetales bacterium]|nr:hypothetical protein [Planctomycetales bacterium]